MKKTRVFFITIEVLALAVLIGPAQKGEAGETITLMSGNGNIGEIDPLNLSSALLSNICFLL